MAGLVAQTPRGAVAFPTERKGLHRDGGAREGRLVSRRAYTLLVFGPTWQTRLQVGVGLILFALWVLNALNTQFGPGAFLPDVWDTTQVPTTEWFTHALQWDPIIGCGTELCR